MATLVFYEPNLAIYANVGYRGGEESIRDAKQYVFIEATLLDVNKLVIRKRVQSQFTPIG